MIKFLKSFKEKILIALACSFIGIGTLLNNTIDTYAYSTNQFSYTFDSYSTSSNQYILHYDSDIDLTTKVKNQYVLLANFNANFNNFGNNNNSFYFVNYTDNNESAMYTNFYFYRLNPSTFIFRLVYSGNFVSNDFKFFCTNFDIVSNNVLLNIDLVSYDELTISPYYDSYIQNLNNQLDSLQNDYDTLLAEYTSYQNTHAYTNEQYNNLMSQNATLTQQVQSLQSQYDTYVSLHSYTNEQYNTLLNTYNNLQTMYNSLQHQYLDLQQEYNRLTIDLAPFRSAIWGNRQATLNGVTIDVSSSSNLNSVVWFRDSYLQIDQREFENFAPYIEGENDFQLVTTSDTIVTINNYTAIANFAHNLDYGFSIEFYLNDSLVNTTMFFHGSMTTDDGGTTNTYNYIAPITFNKMIIDIVGGPGPTSWTESSYFKGNPGTWQQGYDYAVEQLMPRINVLEDSLDEAISKQQVKYNEGYQQGLAIGSNENNTLYGVVIRTL